MPLFGQVPVVTQIELFHRGTGIVGTTNDVALVNVVIALMVATGVPEVYEIPDGSEGYRFCGSLMMLLKNNA